MERRVKEKTLNLHSCSSKKKNTFCFSVLEVILLAWPSLLLLVLACVGPILLGSGLGILIASQLLPNLAWYLPSCVCLQP